ncbi:MAG: hypothetical protein V3V20_04465 [Algisphaera sp.]
MPTSVTSLDLSHAPWRLTAQPSAETQGLLSAELRTALSAGVNATVPSCVHTDLLAAKLIEDPYGLDAEHRLRWMGHTDWTYSTTFELSPAALAHDSLELACDGLDTVATLTLNDQTIGHAANMHRRHRFDLKTAARSGANTLTLHFRAPLDAADEAQERLGKLPHRGHGANKIETPHNAIRKMACSYGWDWGPVIPSAGIWRNIRIEAWSTARIAHVRPAVTQATKDQATVTLAIDFDLAQSSAPPTTSNTQLSATAQLVDPKGHQVATAHLPLGNTAGNTTDTHTGHTLLHIDQPQRWWPVGHGDQPLYTLTVNLHDTHGQTLDSTLHRIGLRTVTLDTTPDTQSGNGSHVEGLPLGGQMTLKVNGQAVFLKGANWIPDDCFPARSEEPDRLKRRINQLVAAHGNCLRIWGGGVFPGTDFLEHCDQTGVLIWQDFMFACAGYPEEEPYRSEVEAEARDNVARLCPHPCVVIYNGNNECIWGAFDWTPDFKALLDPANTRGWGLHYWLDLLPKVIEELDPSRPYWPASPWSGSMDHHPNQNRRGNRHIWNVWHGDGQYRNYLGHYPRMATEFGYHGPPHAATLLPHVPHDQRQWNSPALNFYNRNGGKGQQVHTNLRLADDFIPPHDNLDDWLYLAQVMQARALDMGCTWFRALAPWCSAAVYWQWNDCWPVSSWSAIDSGEREKPLYHATKRFFAPQLATIKPTQPVPEGQAIGSLAVYLHNDTHCLWDGPLTAQRVDLQGNVLDSLTLTTHTSPRSTQRIDLPDTWLDRPTDTALIVRGANTPDAWWWFAPDFDLPYEPAQLEVQLTPTGPEQYQLTLHAQSLIRDLCFYPDRLHPNATINDNLFTLLPGDRVNLTLTCPTAIDLDTLTTAPVMQSVNRFGKVTC